MLLSAALQLSSAGCSSNATVCVDEARFSAGVHVLSAVL
jgi:hypothetical protein